MPYTNLTPGTLYTIGIVGFVDDLGRVMPTDTSHYFVTEAESSVEEIKNLPRYVRLCIGCGKILSPDPMEGSWEFDRHVMCITQVAEGYCICGLYPGIFKARYSVAEVTQIVRFEIC